MAHLEIRHDMHDRVGTVCMHVVIHHLVMLVMNPFQLLLGNLLLLLRHDSLAIAEDDGAQ